MYVPSREENLAHAAVLMRRMYFIGNRVGIPAPVMTYKNLIHFFVTALAMDSRNETWREYFLHEPIRVVGKQTAKVLALTSASLLFYSAEQVFKCFGAIIIQLNVRKVFVYFTQRQLDQARQKLKEAEAQLAALRAAFDKLKMDDQKEIDGLNRRIDRLEANSRAQEKRVDELVQIALRMNR